MTAVIKGAHCTVIILRDQHLIRPNLDHLKYALIISGFRPASLLKASLVLTAQKWRTGLLTSVKHCRTFYSHAKKQIKKQYCAVFHKELPVLQLRDRISQINKSHVRPIVLLNESETNVNVKASHGLRK